jgi:hypothetical protein
MLGGRGSGEQSRRDSAHARRATVPSCACIARAQSVNTIAMMMARDREGVPLMLRRLRFARKRRITSILSLVRRAGAIDDERTAGLPRYPGRSEWIVGKPELGPKRGWRRNGSQAQPSRRCGLDLASAIRVPTVREPAIALPSESIGFLLRRARWRHDAF